MSDAKKEAAPTQPPSPNPQVPKDLTMGAFIKLTLFKIWNSKRWYLLPLWLALAILAAILVLTGHGYVLPAIYLAF